MKSQMKVEMMKMFKFLENIKKKFSKKEEPELDYPDHFLLVTYSEPALEDGTEEDINKLIVRHFLDKYDSPVIEVYRYSKERLHNLKETYGISSYDKTEVDIKFPVWGRINPGEIKYITN